MNKHDPVASGLFAALLHDAAFDGTLPATLGAELGRLVPPDVVIALLSRHRRDPALSTVIHPAHAAGPPQRLGTAAGMAERALEGSVYSGDTEAEEGAADPVTGHVRLVLRASSRARTEIELRFPARRSDQIRTQLTRLLHAVAPDLIHAFRIAELRDRAAAAERLGQAILELLPLPTLLLDRQGALRRSNARGAALLARGDSIIAGADGRIHAIARSANGSLHAALQDRDDRGGAASGAPTVLSVPAGAEKLVMTIRHLLPARDPAADPAAEEEPTTILIAQQTCATLSVRREILLGAFALTSKEAELAESLLNGESIGAYAQRRRMSKQTLRNQLSGILRKTGTTRQAELIGLLTRLAFAPTG